jgi:anti-anti-sigma factor
MAVEFRKIGNVSVLGFRGRLTKNSGDLAMRERFVSLLDAGERKFIFDFRDVPYLDSAALGETVACFKRAREKSGLVKLVLVPGGRPFELFRMTSLDRAFEIYPDEPHALASFE